MPSEADEEYVEKVQTYGSPSKSKVKKNSKVDSIKIEDLMDSDPDIEFIEKDSGMGSKDETPERRAVATAASTTNNGESYDDEPDESLSERLWGLTEMFPESLRNFSAKVTDLSVSSIKGLYKFSCNASWIFFTSSVILFAPVIFETERAQMEEMQKSQQKQVLLGPGTAMAATGAGPALPVIR